jgi:hypothetical protein
MLKSLPDLVELLAGLEKYIRVPIVTIDACALPTSNIDSITPDLITWHTGEIRIGSNWTGKDQVAPPASMKLK